MEQSVVSKHKIALMVNIIAPYRVPVYQAIGSTFELAIFFGGNEGNRSSWQNIEAKLKDIKVKQSWGMTLRWQEGKNGGTYDRRFTQITLGYLFDLLAYNPDAVITNEMGFRTLVALLYGTIFQRPVWVWWGGTLHTEGSRGMARRLLRSLISPLVKHWISYGATSTKYLTSIGVPRERILQIQNCVDERLYLPPTEAAVNLDTKPVFLYVGQMIRRKGVDKLLKAVGKVQAKGHNFSLLLVGGGDEKPALETLAQELGLKNVHFYPPQSPEAMPAIYRSTDYLVFPTLADPWGLVVNEALWSEVPVLSSIYAGCAPELLPKENLFDPLNPDDFEAVLTRALLGEISPVDRSPLKTCAEVADLIVTQVCQTLDS